MLAETRGDGPDHPGGHPDGTREPRSPHDPQPKLGAEAPLPERGG